MRLGCRCFILVSDGAIKEALAMPLKVTPAVGEAARPEFELMVETGVGAVLGLSWLGSLEGYPVLG